MSEKSTYDWQRQEEADQACRAWLKQACETNVDLAELERALFKDTSTQLFDWLDHLVLGASQQTEERLQAIGFENVDAGSDYRVFRHPGALLPSVVLKDGGVANVSGVAVRVDRVHEYLLARGIHCDVEGSPYSGYRRACISHEGGTVFWVVERRGTLTLEPTVPNGDFLERFFKATEIWESRDRCFDIEVREEALYVAIQAAEEMVALVGKDMAADIVMECERRFWQNKNRAAQIQKGRQDKLGMGWANHDHHTFRSSRNTFMLLVRLFEVLGFHCREAFYAGEEAGWGAQVMENSISGFTLFLDLDLSPDEILIDFAHHPLEEKESLGTVGLWCALHGDSIANAGLHHLESQFAFDALTVDLEGCGVGMLAPFSSFSYLKQAFTEGEVWSVGDSRLEYLVAKKLITSEQSEVFRKDGAVGSHLENLERADGYKGFNQNNVSDIIKRLDPRLVEAKEVT